MKEEVWIRKQLRDIEQLQRNIIIQQNKADESLGVLKKESALVMVKIKDLDKVIGGFVSPELEQAIKVVSLRAISIDKKVSDTPCSE